MVSQIPLPGIFKRNMLSANDCYHTYHILEPSVCVWVAGKGREGKAARETQRLGESVEKTTSRVASSLCVPKRDNEAQVQQHLLRRTVIRLPFYVHSLGAPERP